MSLYNPRTRRSERVSRLGLMRAIDREDIDVAYSGDICALVGVKDVITGDTLCDEDFDIRLEPPSFPEPVISMSIEPNSKADQEKMGTAIQRLVAEDPTLRVKTDQDTGQVILSGMGELHLEIILDRMKREFKVEATSGKPQIAYRETVKGAAEGEGKFIRQSGGKGQYGHVLIKLEPNEKGKGIEVINETVGGSIPKEFIKPTIDGIMEGTNNGVVAGHPVVDVIVRITDGSFHAVDSSELAFKMAGIFAFKDAMKKADPDPPRADHGRRGDDPRGIPGRPDRRHQPPPRHDPRHGEQGGRLHHRGHRPPGDPLRLRDGHPLALQGARQRLGHARPTSSRSRNSLLQKIVESHRKGPGPHLTPVLFTP